MQILRLMSKDLPQRPDLIASPIGDLAFHFGQFFPNCWIFQLFYLSVRGKKHICFRCFSELFKNSPPEFGDTKYIGSSSCRTALSLQQSKGVSIQIIIDIVFPQPRPLFCATSLFVCISSLCLANSLLQFKNWFSAEYPFGFLNETLLHVLV